VRRRSPLARASGRRARCRTCRNSEKDRTTAHRPRSRGALARSQNTHPPRPPLPRALAAELLHRRDSLRSASRKSLVAVAEDDEDEATDSDDEEGDAVKAAKRAAQRAAALPEGWTEHHDERSDRMYWYNNASGVSSWIKPTCSPRAGQRGGARARPRIVPGQVSFF
jgi:hypothetical protein